MVSRLGRRMGLLESLVAAGDEFAWVKGEAMAMGSL